MSITLKCHVVGFFSVIKSIHRASSQQYLMKVLVLNVWTLNVSGKGMLKMWFTNKVTPDLPQNYQQIMLILLSCPSNVLAVYRLFYVTN